MGESNSPEGDEESGERRGRGGRGRKNMRDEEKVTARLTENGEMTATTV